MMAGSYLGSYLDFEYLMLYDVLYYLPFNIHQCTLLCSKLCLFNHVEMHQYDGMEIKVFIEWVKSEIMS